MAWFLLAPISYILWTISYYFVYFCLSLFSYGLLTAGTTLKIILILSIPAITYTMFRILISSTMLTVTLATKHKITCLLTAFIYSTNRIMSVVQYCSVKSPVNSNAVIIEAPCWVNLLITFTQIILIFSSASVAIITTIKNETA